MPKPFAQPCNTWKRPCTRSKRLKPHPAPRMNWPLPGKHLRKPHLQRLTVTPRQGLRQQKPLLPKKQPLQQMTRIAPQKKPLPPPRAPSSPCAETTGQAHAWPRLLLPSRLAAPSATRDVLLHAMARVRVEKASARSAKTTAARARKHREWVMLLSAHSALPLNARKPPYAPWRRRRTAKRWCKS